MIDSWVEPNSQKITLEELHAGNIPVKLYKILLSGNGKEIV